MINAYGILDSDGEPPCPVCGEPLGYYAEFGDEIECDNCGCKMNLSYETIIHYDIYEVGKNYTINRESLFFGEIERVEVNGG